MLNEKLNAIIEEMDVNDLIMLHNEDSLYNDEIQDLLVEYKSEV